MVQKYSVSLLSSDLHNKLAISLLLDKKGYRLLYVNPGKLTTVNDKPVSSLLSSDLIIIDYDSGLGDNPEDLLTLIQLLDSCNICIMSDSQSLAHLQAAIDAEHVVLTEKPLLPADFFQMFEAMFVRKRKEEHKEKPHGIT